MNRKRLPLGVWITVQMIMLALLAVVIIGGGMWYRYARWYDQEDSKVPPTIKAEIQSLEPQSDSPAAKRRLAEIDNQYYDDPPVRDDLIILASLIGVTIPFILLFGFWASRHIALPVTRVTIAANRVANGDFHIRAETVPGAPAELQNLSTNFNLMAERLEGYDRERRDSSAAAAHEIRTPLTAAKARLQGVLDGVFPLEKTQIEMVVRQLDQLNRLVDDLQTFSLALSGQLALHLSMVRLRPLIEERLSWALPKLQNAGVTAQIEVDDALLIIADRGRFGQVLSILIDNVARHATGTETLLITARTDAEGLSLVVADRGPGIPSHAVTRIFERFWRADQSRMRDGGGGGSGLGLSIAQAICEAHGGLLTARNRDGGGAELEIRLAMSSLPGPATIAANSIPASGWT